MPVRDLVRMHAADRMRRFDSMPLAWRDAARRTSRTHLEYRYPRGVALASALKRLRLDPLTLTD